MLLIQRPAVEVGVLAIAAYVNIAFKAVVTVGVGVPYQLTFCRASLGIALEVLVLFTRRPHLQHLSAVAARCLALLQTGQKIWRNYTIISSSFYFKNQIMGCYLYFFLTSWHRIFCDPFPCRSIFYKKVK